MLFIAAPAIFLFASSAMALIIGIAWGITIGNPYKSVTKNLVPRIFGAAIVGLGASINLYDIAVVGMRGVAYTFVTIALTLLLAHVLGNLFNIRKNLSTLLGVGTAICGGSAIAATSSAIKADVEDISIAMSVVFLLNAVALFIFPFLGTQASLTQTQFGLWSALAVHDTSSVIATSAAFGAEALVIGTTVKLARALWIAPVSLALSIARKDSIDDKKFSIPWFILGFIISAAVVTFFPSLQNAGTYVAACSKKLLTVGLFFVGLNISIDSIRKLGLKTLSFGVLLWMLVAMFTLAAVKYNLIRL